MRIAGFIKLHWKPHECDLRSLSFPPLLFTIVAHQSKSNEFLPIVVLALEWQVLLFLTTFY